MSPKGGRGGTQRSAHGHHTAINWPALELVDGLKDRASGFLGPAAASPRLPINKVAQQIWHEDAKADLMEEGGSRIRRIPHPACSKQCAASRASIQAKH